MSLLPLDDQNPSIEASKCDSFQYILERKHARFSLERIAAYFSMKLNRTQKFISREEIEKCFL
jgi:hypothetical protein